MFLFLVIGTLQMSLWLWWRWQTNQWLLWNKLCRIWEHSAV